MKTNNYGQPIHPVQDAKRPRLYPNDIAVLKAIRKAVKATYWIQRRYYKTFVRGTHKGETGCCMVGLVNKHTECDLETSSQVKRFVGYAQRGRVLQALEWAIKKYRPKTNASYIENFNDSRITKREDVLAVLDIAIKGEQ